MKDEIIRAVRRLADENGGVPLGERAFFRATGMTVKTLQRAGFATYGEARETAGYHRGRLTARHSDDAVFEPLARLTRKNGRFPTLSEMNVAHHADPAKVPSRRVFSRVAQRGPLVDQLREWCDSHSEFADVAQVLANAAAPYRVSQSARSTQVVTGYVYLMRYGTRGRYYKVGFTENVPRRQVQLDMMSPSDVRVVHVIATDDPRGIEKYWQQRFASRQVKNKEVFELLQADIAAFKRRRYQ